MTVIADIKAGAAQLTLVAATYYGRAAKIGEPAYYYRIDTGELVFANCRDCGGTFSKEELAARSASPWGVRNLCRGCARKQARAYLELNRKRTDREILVSRNKLWPSGLKKCGTCGEKLSFLYFSPARKNLDGLDSICCFCSRHRMNNGGTQRKFAKYRTRTPKDILEAQLKLRPTGTKTCRKCCLEMSLTDFPSDITRSDGLDDKCKYCTNDHAWKIAARTYWQSINLELKCFYGNGCAFESYDHILSRKNGGRDTPENLVPCCLSHNASKQDKYVNEWAEIQGFDWSVLRKKFIEYGFWVENALDTSVRDMVKEVSDAC